MPIQKYMETVLFLSLDLFDACDLYQTFLCVLTFAAYVCEFLLNLFFL